MISYDFSAFSMILHDSSPFPNIPNAKITQFDDSPGFPPFPTIFNAKILHCSDLPTISQHLPPFPTQKCYIYTPPLRLGTELLLRNI